MPISTVRARPKKATPWIRRSVQIFFLVVVALVATNEILGERGIQTLSFICTT